MSGSNAGVPVTPPSAEPIERGPFRIWRGHPSPVPWFGQFEADPAYWYTVADRNSSARYSPLCHICAVLLIYRFGGFCDVTWARVPSDDRSCDWCDRLISACAPRSGPDTHRPT